MAHVSGDSSVTIALLVVVLCSVAYSADSRAVPTPASGRLNYARKLAFLVKEPPQILEYHNGPIMSTVGSIPIHVIWYGTFADPQRSIVRDFLNSFQSEDAASPSVITPSVVSWWKLTAGYKDAAGASVQGSLHLGNEISDAYSRGKSLTNADLEALVVDSLPTLTKDPNSIYVVLTADDVLVDDFCMNSCASHFSTTPSPATGGQQLPFGWVGNAATQCPGLCAWPYAKAAYGPNKEPLVAPNGDVGMDGVIINLGTILTGTATNPFNNGFYEGDAAAPLEASTACPATYGVGAFPGDPGLLLVDAITGASYNVNGANDRKFLLPAIWDPVTLKCTPPA